MGQSMMLKSDVILSHIVAASENGVIGLKGKLPWVLPQDLKFFREKTKNHAVIMGRKTFTSLKGPLRNRLNVVLTKRRDYKVSSSQVILTFSLKEAIQACVDEKEKYGKEIFIIGGGEIYRESLPLVDQIYLTRIYKTFEGDAFYPEIDSSQFQKVSDKCFNDSSIKYSFLHYKRKV